MELKIKDLIGARCIIKDDGQKIFDLIHSPLTNGEVVTLDFKDVHQFASPFFNFALGQLLKDIKVEDLRRLLKLKNLDSSAQHIIKRVIENATQYQTDINYQKIVDDILEQQAKDTN